MKSVGSSVCYRLFVKHVLGKDSFPVFVFRKAASDFLYFVNVLRLLLFVLFLKLRNLRLKLRVRSLQRRVSPIHPRTKRMSQCNNNGSSARKELSAKR